MANVLIHRCTLRIIRRGGWNWGPDPSRLAQDAVRALPDLLARKLAELMPDEEDREITAPVRIRLSIRMSELSEQLSPSRSPGAAPVSSTLDRRMEAACREAFGLVQTPPTDVPAPLSREHDAIGKSVPAHQQATAQRGGALARLLLSWHEHGVLKSRLFALSIDQLEVWHARLRDDVAAGVPEQPDPARTSRLESFVAARSSSSSPESSMEIYRRRIVTAVQAAAEFLLPLTHFELWQVLDRLMPAEPSTAPAIRVASPADTVVPSRQSPRLASSAHTMFADAGTVERTSPDKAFSHPSPTREVKVSCALPFLLLGPLSRLGYLDTLAAVLEAANLSEDGVLFATALAYKVLDPPQRGWRRSAESVQSAAALAGLSKAVPEESLVDFARRMTRHTGALDILLADALIAGHTPGEPVTLDSDGASGFLLLDTQGCFPIAWKPDPASVLELLKRLGVPVVLISGAAAGTFMLHHLDSAGVDFVIDVPPARGESWRRIQEGPELLGWTNYAGPTTESLRRAAHQMQTAWDEAGSLSKELTLARPGVIRAGSLELDRSLTLAAGIASGMISWKLWQGRGRTSPQQLLERYADLEGRIRFDGSSVTVTLPLGRRHRELSEHGLLGPIDGVPWLGGRRIEFGGG